MNGAERIAAERQRQIEEEGWTPEHDDEHDCGELAMAAVCFAAPEKIYARQDSAGVTKFYDPWPRDWDGKWDKRRECGDVSERELERNFRGIPPADPEEYTDGERLDLLTKAGALVAAEIDRVLRAQAVKEKTE